MPDSSLVLRLADERSFGRISYVETGEAYSVHISMLRPYKAEVDLDFYRLTRESFALVAQIHDIEPMADLEDRRREAEEQHRQKCLREEEEQQVRRKTFLIKQLESDRREDQDDQDTRRAFEQHVAQEKQQREERYEKERQDLLMRQRECERRRVEEDQREREALLTDLEGRRHQRERRENERLEEARELEQRKRLRRQRQQEQLPRPPVDQPEYDRQSASRPFQASSHAASMAHSYDPPVNEVNMTRQPPTLQYHRIDERPRLVQGQPLPHAPRAPP